MKRTMIFSVLFFFIAFFNVTAQEEPFRITHGPYLQEMGETGVTVMWTTNRKAIAWVELAPDDGTHFYLRERPRHFSAPYGFKEITCLHAVRLDRIEAGTTYRYRIYSQEVLSHKGTKVIYGDVVASDVFREKPLTFTTNNMANKETSFLVFNDIHGNNELLGNLWKNSGLTNPDLVFFNGDMVSDIQSEEQLLGGFMDTAVKLFAREIPMYYARGNHETRGSFADSFASYFPGETGLLYYQFRQGPVSFLVLDCGEDKPDSDVEYSGIVAFDAYREKQTLWLKETLQSDVFRKASYRVVIMHMPPFGGWHGEKQVEELFIPLLNEAKVDVIFCGHLHRHVIQKAVTGRDYPIIVNSNTNVVRAEADDSRMKIEILNAEGNMVETLTISKH